MKIIFLPFLAIWMTLCPAVNAQNQFFDEADALFGKIMAQINTRHVKWVKSTADEANKKQLSPEDINGKAQAYGVLNSMNGQDIEAIAFLVLMQAAKSSQEDLKAIMAQVKSINEQKEKLRSASDLLNNPQAITRIRLDSLKNVAAQTQVIQTNNKTLRQQPVLDNSMNANRPARTNNTVTKAEIDATKDKIKNDLDSMSEMGEMESLRLQMAMNRMSKMMSTLSNILKKISDTSQSIIQNLK